MWPAPDWWMVAHIMNPFIPEDVATHEQIR